MFSETGELKTIIEAPECTYDGAQRTAHSPGRLKMQSGDGRYFVEGEGFLWRQDADSLTISNQVHTTIRELTQTTNSP